MASLIVSGLSIPVSGPGISRDRLDGADRARAFDQTYRASVTGNPKRDFHFSTIPIKRDRADMYEGVLAVVTPQTCSGDVVGGSQNLLLWSEDLTNAAWTKAAVTVGSNVFTAPNGTLTVDKIQEDNTNANHAVTQSTTNAVGPYTFSDFLFPADRTKAVLSMSDGTGGFASIGIDLTNGTTFSSTLAVGSWTGITSTVTAWPDGFYRGRVSGIRGAGTVTVAQVFVWSTAIAYTGTTGMGVDSWGAQLEPGLIASSYAKTTTAAAASTLAASCCTEIVGWHPIQSPSGHYVVLDLVLHEV
jgi:hypothetical protein